MNPIHKTVSHTKCFGFASPDCLPAITEFYVFSKDWCTTAEGAGRIFSWLQYIILLVVRHLNLYRNWTRKRIRDAFDLNRPIKSKLK